MIRSASWLCAALLLDLIGGSPDSAHPAVVAVVSGGSLCTGVMIQLAPARGFVLTAATCCDPSALPTDILFGPDINSPLADFSVVASSIQVDPAYDSQNPGAGHDFCVLQFDVGASTFQFPAPVPVITPAQDDPVAGMSLGLVGYGVTDATTQNGAGVRRSTTVTLASNDAATLTSSFSSTGGCNGDTGGPELATLDGGELMVATISFGDQNCNQYTVGSRVTASYAFLQPFLPAAPDAGTMDDGGGIDAGGTDAGTSTDAGTGTDAGSGSDAGQTADAGTTPDSGSDAGQAADAGATSGGTSGSSGGCASGPGSDSELPLLLLLAASLLAPSGLRKRAR